MDGDFHDASIMGHDILGLSAGLDSISSLLGLEPCSDSIYSSVLGLEDVHQDGSVIDYSFVDSVRCGLEEDLDTTHIPLDGLIPLVAPHQCPTPPYSFGSARVKVRKDFVNFDTREASSIDESGLLPGFLSDAILSTSLSTTPLASLTRSRTPPKCSQEKAADNLESEGATATEDLDNIPSFLTDVIVSTNLSTSPLASLHRVRTPPQYSQGKAASSLDSEGATSIEASASVSSLLNDAIVPANLSTAALASSSNIGKSSTKTQGKRVGSKRSKTSRKKSTTQAPASTKKRKKKKRSPKKARSAQKARSAKKARSVKKAQSAKNAQSARKAQSAKKAQSARKVQSAEEGRSARKAQSAKEARSAKKAQSATEARSAKKAQSATEARSARKAPSAKKARSARKAQSTKEARSARKVQSGRKELKVKRSQELKVPKHFKCSTCGAVYKSHELCVKHVLDRHKPGMSIKHQPYSTVCRNAQKPQNIRLQQRTEPSFVKPYTNSTKIKNSPDFSRFTTTAARRARKDFDSKFDLVPETLFQPFAKNLETRIDCKNGSTHGDRKSSTVESKCMVGTKRKRSQSPKVHHQSPRVNVPLQEVPQRIFSDPSEFIPDLGGQETEDEPDFSDVTPVHALNQCSQISPRKEESVACKENREATGRPTNGAKKLKISSKTVPELPNRISQKRTKEDVGSGERMVYLLDPRKLTIVICPRCQKAFTTYAGYSHHTVQVHNVSANNLPGKLMQLLVQRSPQYCSKNTPKQGCHELQKNRLHAKDGMHQQTIKVNMYNSSAAFSSTLKENMSDRSQLSFKTTATATSDVPRTLTNNNNGITMHARATQTDILDLQEPLDYQQKKGAVTLSQSKSKLPLQELKSDAYIPCSRTSLTKERKGNERGSEAIYCEVESRTCSSLVNLLPRDVKHKHSVQKSSKTAKDQTGTIIDHGGSLLCTCCGAVFEDSSGHDDNRQLRPAPVELESWWTAGGKADEVNSFLCSVCGIYIPSGADFSSHSCCHEAYEESSGLLDSHQPGSFAGEVVHQRMAQEDTVAGDSFLCSVCGIQIPSHADFTGHSCELNLSEGVQLERKASPSCRLSMDVGNQEHLESHPRGATPKGVLDKDSTGLDENVSMDHMLEQCQGLLNQCNDFSIGEQPKDSSTGNALKAISAGIDKRLSDKLSGCATHARIKTVREHENLGHCKFLDPMHKQSQALLNQHSSVTETEKPQETLKRISTDNAKELVKEKQSHSMSHVKLKIVKEQKKSVPRNSLNHMLEQPQVSLNESSCISEGEQLKHRSESLKRINVGTGKRQSTESAKSAVHATVRMPQEVGNSCLVTLDSMLEQCQKMLEECTDVLKA